MQYGNGDEMLQRTPFGELIQCTPPNWILGGTHKGRTEGVGGGKDRKSGKVGQAGEGEKGRKAGIDPSKNLANLAL